jgi:hypothetical protein
MMVIATISHVTPDRMCCWLMAGNVVRVGSGSWPCENAGALRHFLTSGGAGKEPCQDKSSSEADDLATRWKVSQSGRLTMNDSNPPSSARPGRPAWNKGKLPGPKPPLRPGHVWSIRAKLQLERHTRDLAMFNLATDNKLRGCDLVAPLVFLNEVTDSGYLPNSRGVPMPDWYHKSGQPPSHLTPIGQSTAQALHRVRHTAGRPASIR